ncbi:hypothetical protein RND81_09G062700 [Saponaria officinalis]|uniref:Uncharacterized protein n=1 Tax=Saponaria officinalis TaxID=3572 RepID=A0AAW1IIP9_SAPOF
MESRLLLDVVISEGTTILQLLTCKDKSLLVWRNALLILNLGLHIVNSVGTLDLKGDGFSSQGFDEDLHSTSQTEDKVKGRFLLNIVIGQSAAILELFSCKDKPLLVWGDGLLILDLGFDIDKACLIRVNKVISVLF